MMTSSARTRATTMPSSVCACKTKRWRKLRASRFGQMADVATSLAARLACVLRHWEFGKIARGYGGCFAIWQHVVTMLESARPRRMAETLETVSAQIGALSASVD